MNRWAVKIKDHATKVDPAPWIDYQGDSYTGLDGARFLVVEDPDSVDKVGKLKEEPKDNNTAMADVVDVQLIKQY